MGGLCPLDARPFPIDLAGLRCSGDMPVCRTIDALCRHIGHPYSADRALRTRMQGQLSSCNVRSKWRSLGRSWTWCLLDRRASFWKKNPQRTARKIRNRRAVGPLAERACFLKTRPDCATPKGRETSYDWGYLLVWRDETMTRKATGLAR